MLNVFHDSDSGDIECRVYERLGSHPNFADVLVTRTDGSIILERGTPFSDDLSGFLRKRDTTSDESWLVERCC